MHKYSENRAQYLSKFKSYINFSQLGRFIDEYEHHKYAFNLLYRNEQVGGSIITDQLNLILEKQVNMNIKVEEESSDDKTIRVLFYTIDDKNICLGLIIDTLQGFATISDLRNYDNCVYQSSNVTNVLMKFSIEIADQMNMTHVELSDRSYYTCTSVNMFKNNCDVNVDNTLMLSLANTLTNGQPYYYDFGFEYKDSRDKKIAIDNRLILKNTLTRDLDYLTIMRKLKSLLMEKECNDKFIMQNLKLFAKLYEKNIEKNIKVFLRDLKYKDCYLFSMIYRDVQIMLKIEIPLVNKMVFKLLTK
jgi:hypothetical protein